MLIVNFFLELWTGYIIVQVWTRYTGRISGGRQETSDTRFYLGILLFRSGPGILAGFLEADRRHRMQDIYLGILLFRSWPGILTGFLEADRRHLIQNIYLGILLFRSWPGRQETSDTVYLPVYIIVKVWTRYTGRISGGRQKTSDARYLS